MSEEEKKNVCTSQDELEVASPKRAPLSLLFLSGFNFFILGIASFIFFLFIYLNISSSVSQNLFGEFKNYFPDRQLNSTQFKLIILSQMIIALVFLLSGLGLLLRKEIARKITVYFSFCMVILAFLVALTNPSFIRQVILQIIYPGTLIFYFTNRKIEGYFRKAKK